MVLAKIVDVIFEFFLIGGFEEPDFVSDNVIFKVIHVQIVAFYSSDGNQADFCYIICMADNNFTMNDIFGQFKDIFGGGTSTSKAQNESMRDAFSKAAEANEVNVLREENAQLKQEIENILRCPNCGTKLRMKSK